MFAATKITMTTKMTPDGAMRAFVC